MSDIQDVTCPVRLAHLPHKWKISANSDILQCSGQKQQGLKRTWCGDADEHELHTHRMMGKDYICPGLT